jgi:hypothetical protein
VIFLAEDKKKTKKGNGEDRQEEQQDDVYSEDADQDEQEEAFRKLQEEINKLSSKDIITQMMMSLSSFAYKKMGLPVGVNDKYKDRQQAKLAVDGFDALLKVILDEVNAEERENLKSSLSNLQINFVKIFP